MRKRSVSVAVLLLGSILAVSACSVFGPDDKAIVSEIQARLFQDSVLKTRDIRVTANKGMVILTGTVNTELEKSAVERLVGQVSGVKQVENQLSVSTQAAAEVNQNVPPAAEPAPAEQPTPIAEAPARPAERPRARKSERIAGYREERRQMAARNASAAPAQEELTPSSAPAPASAGAPVQAAAAPPMAPSPPPPPKPVRVTIPVGTVITVQMIDSVDSTRDRAGQEFNASVVAPVVIGERVVIPQGADARVRLVTATSAGRMSGTSELALQLSGVTIAGNTYDTDATTYQQKGTSRGKRTAETVGGGAVLGGLIGAIAGHGKGAAIGSVIGAGAGTAAEAGTKAPPVRVSSETKLDFTLRTPILVTLPPSGSSREQ